MIRILPCARLLLLALIAAPLPAAAQESRAASPTTRLISYSAVLPDAGPDAIAGARTITFALYDEAEDGTRLWSETQVVNVDARGHYSAHLGAVTPLPLEIFRTEQARWLEVSVDGRALPRTMLVAVPYALRAVDADTLAGTPASEFVRTDGEGRRVRGDGTTADAPLVDGSGVTGQLAKWNGPTTLSSSIITESFDNRIGVFAPDPTGGGVVDARFTIRHLDNNTAIGVLNTTNQRRFALNTSAFGWTLYDGFDGSWNDGLKQRGGHAGVGDVVANARFTVRGRGDTFSFFSSPPAETALYAVSDGGPAVVAASRTGVGLRAQTGTFGGDAAEFFGDVSVSGSLSKGGGSFTIDHPLDPANKYLRHSFVESPDMMNVYNGNITLDAHGEAWVTLPDWFEALNRDFRYQLTSIGAPGPNLHIASKIAGNRFRIAGGTAGAEVSWQVTGIRQDAWANAHRIVVEEKKRPEDRGAYLHPAERGFDASALVPSIRKHIRIRPPR